MLPKQPKQTPTHRPFYFPTSSLSPREIHSVFTVLTKNINKKKPNNIQCAWQANKNKYSFYCGPIKQYQYRQPRSLNSYYSFNKDIEHKVNNNQNTMVKKPIYFTRLLLQNKTKSAIHNTKNTLQSDSRNKLDKCVPLKSASALKNNASSSVVNDRGKSGMVSVTNNSRCLDEGLSHRNHITDRLASNKIVYRTSLEFRLGSNNLMRKDNNNGAQNYDNYLNKYEIVKELGKGMYGVVHLAKKKKEEKNHKFRNYSLKLHVWRNDDNEKDQLLANIGNNPEQNNFTGQPQNKQPTISQQTQHLNQTATIIEQQLRQNPQEIQQQQKFHQTEQPLYAIKIYEKFKMNKDPQKFKKIRKEILVMQNIEHPNIIKLYQTADTLTKISLVVEYGGNQSLLDYLRLHHPISQTSQKRIGKQLLSVLMYLHGKNIVHRDIKLQNILMKDEQVKVIDFGFSTLTNRNRRLNTICGTPNYMAPQVLANQQYIGQCVDIWAYGIVMYALGQGKHPFIATNYNQLERLVKKGVYQFRKIVNPIHQAFIKKILRINPEQRPKASQLMNHPWLNIE